jgi:hypothetical protein
MKKIVLQICFVLGLTVAAAVSGTAQTSQSYRAHIPFDFTVNNIAMKAGDYRLGPVAGLADTRGLQITNLKNGKGKLLGIAKLGAAKWGDRTGRLVFTKTAGDYALSNIETPTFVLNVPKIRTNVKVLTKVTEGSETVSIALQ